MSDQPVTASSHSTAYRAEIDGLRAVAVLSVVWFHAFPNWGGGGFVGVDIFFVISGFLISTIVFDQVAADRFSYLDFYDRRIRRIFPALTVVLLACLIFAVTIAFPADTRQIGQHLMAGAGFVSNLVLWNEAGYFESASELKPLLHLWSLSVEEQYYIAWPLVVTLLFKRPKLFVVALLSLLVASFALNVAIVHSHPGAAFYLPPTRIWELLVGSALAYVARKHELPVLLAETAGKLFSRFPRVAPPSQVACAHLLGWVGAALLAAALLLTTREAAFPGWWALLPTLGAFCLIGAGPNAWFNRRVLASRPAVFVGKISYPLYLWHWPLLVAPNVMIGSASRTGRMAAVLASVVLAWLTYEYIEKAIRFGSRRARTPLALAGAMGLIGIAGAALVVTDGWVNRFPIGLREIATAQFKFDYADYRLSRCFLGQEQTVDAFRPECVSPSPPGVPKVLLWGDSHAAHLYPGLRALLGDGQYIELTQLTSATCPPIEGFSVAMRPNCGKINDAVLQRIAAQRPDVVLMVANWSQHNGEGGWGKLDLVGLQRTAKHLVALGVGHVVIVGQMPRWKVALPIAMLRQWRESGSMPVRSTRDFNSFVYEADASVRDAAAAAGVDYFSPLASLCNAEGCELTISADGLTYPMAWDDAHLTSRASEAVVRRWQHDLFKDPRIQAAIGRLAAQKLDVTRAMDRQLSGQGNGLESPGPADGLTSSDTRSGG